MQNTISNLNHYESWESFINHPNDFIFDSPLTRTCSSEILCNTDWVDNLINDNSTSITLQSYQNDFRNDFENRCIEISNFDPEQTTEEDIITICSQCGEIDQIDISQKSIGHIFVTFFDLRSAYLMIRSTIRVRGFKWLNQFCYQHMNQNTKNSMNNGTIVIFNIPISVSDTMLIEQFSIYGTIREIRKYKSNRFIEFWDIRASEQAVHSMNDKQLFTKKMRIEFSRSNSFHNNSHIYIDNRMPTIARVSKRVKKTVKLEICRPTSPDEKSIINRVSKSTKPPLVFSFGENRINAYA
jgi:RNA recognition motif-containing protein